MHQFDLVGHVVADARKRLSLAFAGVVGNERFAVSVAPTGHFLLTPLERIHERERPVWESFDLMESLNRGIADAAAGRVVSLGSLKRYLDLKEDEGGGGPHPD
jgi:hypothetical protein